MSTTKRCFKCEIAKPIVEFYKHPAMGDGYLGKCKECTKKDTKAQTEKNKPKYLEYLKERYRGNIESIFAHRYFGIRTRTNGSCARVYGVRGKEMLSKAEFTEWCHEPANLRKFKLLYRKWVKSGFSRTHSPSIDRIDNEKPYVLGNLQWITQSENSKKSNRA